MDGQNRLVNKNRGKEREERERLQHDIYDVPHGWNDAVVIPVGRLFQAAGRYANGRCTQQAIVRHTSVSGGLRVRLQTVADWEQALSMLIPAGM